MAIFFLTIHFKYFDFIELFDLNSNSNSLLEILSINEFLEDFVMCLYIFYIAFKILKFCSLGLIIMKLHLSFSFIASCLSISLLTSPSL